MAQEDTMKITNKHDLPAAFVDYAKADRYSKGDADISVTTLIDSPRIRILKDEHQGDLEADASEMIWPLLGTAVHSILEQSNPTGNVVKEERLFMNVNGWTLSGAIDHQEIIDGTVHITDYKVTSVWSVILGKKEWELQQNIYAHMVRRVKGMPVGSISICAVLRDWNRRDAMLKPDYPQSPVTTVRLNLWDDGKAQAYIEDRISAHQSAQMEYDLLGTLADCTSEERWAKNDVWAVKKPGNKKALKLCSSHQEAIDYVASSTIKLEIEVRKGEYTRCANYCSVSEFCSQWAVDRVSQAMEE
jgi:hypothetical protein